MSKRVKIIASVAVLVVLSFGVVAGVYLINQQQEIREKAATPQGQATVSISPADGTLAIGQSLPVSIYFNTENIPISAIAVRVQYPYSGASPALTASNIQINSALLSTGNWTCPVKRVYTEAMNAHIDIACVNTSTTGFITSTNTLLATFTLTANSVPATNPTVLSFDPVDTIITDKATGQDVLLIPTSVGSYRVASLASTSTPTPTGGGIGGPNDSGVTPTPTPTLRPTLTPTPKATISATLTPTPISSLPDTGFSLPTIIFGVSGLFIVLVSLLLVF